MIFDFFSIEGPCLITPEKHGDNRGYFMETYQQEKFEEAIDRAVTFIQDNHSLSTTKGTVRGLHYQSPPVAQGKLIRCIKGGITDIAVDARANSPTYGKHIKVILSAENAKQLWVPEGFLHGFATLEDNTEVVYKVTNYYNQESDGNVQWNDPDLAIDWGIDEDLAVLSKKDKNAPCFSAFVSPFIS